MSLITWIALGLITGLVARRLVSRPDESRAADIALGILGALVCGALARAFGVAGGMSVASLAFALAGACAVLAGYHWFTRRTVWDGPTVSCVQFRAGYGRHLRHSTLGQLLSPPVWRHPSPITPRIRTRSRPDGRY